jgi:hypothetical protein
VALARVVQRTNRTRVIPPVGVHDPIDSYSPTSAPAGFQDRLVAIFSGLFSDAVFALDRRLS